MASDAVPLAPPPTGWTVADVDALPDTGVRYELVDGVPRIMTPPKLKHQQARRRLANLLEQEAPRISWSPSRSGVILAPDQRPVPDVAIIRGFESISGELSNFPADRVVLVAEVVSRSTRSEDRFRKPGLYAQSLIGTYLRVELDPPHAVAYRLGPDGPYVEVGPGRAGAAADAVRALPGDHRPGGVAGLSAASTRSQVAAKPGCSGSSSQPVRRHPAHLDGLRGERVRQRGPVRAGDHRGVAPAAVVVDEPAGHGVRARVEPGLLGRLPAGGLLGRLVAVAGAAEQSPGAAVVAPHARGAAAAPRRRARAAARPPRSGPSAGGRARTRSSRPRRPGVPKTREAQDLVVPKTRECTAVF